MATDSRRDEVRREVLPIPDKPPVGLTTYDAKDPDTSYPPIVPLRPPEGAPNVLIVLIDDVGFGASSAFGGPVEMPTAERLGSPVAPHYGPRDNAFNGEVTWALTGAERFHVAMAVQ